VCKLSVIPPLCLVLALTLLAGCGGSSHSTGTASPNPAPLSADNLNLIFVVSEDVLNNAPGDIDLSTANLTDQGLRRSLKLATFLQQHVLGTENVTDIYALEPTTHLQTKNDYPDMVALETIQQFALLNQITLSSAPPPDYIPYTGNSYPINASYASGAIPTGVATPSPTLLCPGCQGLDFTDQGGDNETLIAGIITVNVPGFYVFSAPWETISALLANINNAEGYKLTIPASYKSPNYIYAITIAPSGSASLVTYNSNLNPSSSYPTLPAPTPVSTPCAAQTPFVIDTSTTPGAVIPEGVNTNETLYIIRHADAHPLAYWTDGNYVCAGQWRALDLPSALSGKLSPSPQQVYSIDPAQISPGTQNSWSSVAPSLTVEPYAIANNLPYGLAASFNISDSNSASEFFFTNKNGGTFSNQTVLVAWAYQFIQPMVNALVSSYGVAATAPAWPDTDYDTIWTVHLDGAGNLTVSNAMCEGIDSASLPVTCPKF